MASTMKPLFTHSSGNKRLALTNEYKNQPIPAMLFDAWNKENIETGIQNLDAKGIIGKWILVDLDF